ncbi:MAG: hypothetical protein KGJ06_08930, partial [Pseudomonadota bacterium]|nr:hypothetical protein [Pseudomonadota bacterium]
MPLASEKQTEIKNLIVKSVEAPPAAIGAPHGVSIGAREENSAQEQLVFEILMQARRGVPDARFTISYSYGTGAGYGAGNLEGVNFKWNKALNDQLRVQLAQPETGKRLRSTKDEKRQWSEEAQLWDWELETAERGRQKQLDIDDFKNEIFPYSKMVRDSEGRLWVETVKPASETGMTLEARIDHNIAELVSQDTFNTIYSSGYRALGYIKKAAALEGMDAVHTDAL